MDVTRFLSPRVTDVYTQREIAVAVKDLEKLQKLGLVTFLSASTRGSAYGAIWRTVD